MLLEKYSYYIRKRDDNRVSTPHTMDNAEPVIYLSTGCQDMMPPYTEDWFCVYCYDDVKDTTEFHYHINL